MADIDLAFSNHANVRMRQRNITLEDIANTLVSPTAVREGGTAIQYDGVAEDGRPIAVVIAKGTNPPKVITVEELWEGASS